MNRAISINTTLGRFPDSIRDLGSHSSRISYVIYVKLPILKSYFKSLDFFSLGTTWAEQISLLIKHGGDTSKLEGSHIRKMIPFIELCMDSKNPEVCHFLPVT